MLWLRAEGGDSGFFNISLYVRFSVCVHTVHVSCVCSCVYIVTYWQ